MIPAPRSTSRVVPENIDSSVPEVEILITAFTSSDWYAVFGTMEFIAQDSKVLAIILNADVFELVIVSIFV